MSNIRDSRHFILIRVYATVYTSYLFERTRQHNNTFERTQQKTLQTEPNVRDTMHHTQLLLACTVTVDNFKVAPPFSLLVISGIGILIRPNTLLAYTVIIALLHMLLAIEM